jgi:glycosyltransferase involved in cell wall biosynthesis
VINRFLSSVPLACFNPDIVHRTYYSFPPYPSNSYKTVLTVYDMIHEIYPGLFSSKDQTSALKRQAVKTSDHIICISHSTKNDLLHYFNVDPSKVSVVHLGVRHNSTDVAAYKHNRPYLLYVGSRYGYKNFRFFLEAYHSSDFLRSHYDVICFGGGSFSFSELNFFRSIDCSLSNIFNLQGSDSLLKSLYLGASCLVYPSLYEGFGIPPLEAMHYGCPVICSNSSSLPEVVGSSAVLFDPKSPLSIKAAIESTLSQPTLLDELISSGKVQSLEFSWLKCANHTFNIYKSLS